MGERNEESRLTLDAAENADSSSDPIIDLTEMTLEDIVALHADISYLIDNKDREPDELPAKLDEAFDAGIAHLCVEQPDAATNLLELLGANQSSLHQRVTAATAIGSLAAINREAAIALAAVLLCDGDERVWELARYKIGDAWAAGALTLSDVVYLLRIHAHEGQRDIS